MANGSSNVPESNEVVDQGLKDDARAALKRIEEREKGGYGRGGAAGEIDPSPGGSGPGCD